MAAVNDEPSNGVTYSQIGLGYDTTGLTTQVAASLCLLNRLPEHFTRENIENAEVSIVWSQWECPLLSDCAFSMESSILTWNNTSDGVNINISGIWQIPQPLQFDSFEISFSIDGVLIPSSHSHSFCWENAFECIGSPLLDCPITTAQPGQTTNKHICLPSLITRTAILAGIQFANIPVGLTLKTSSNQLLINAVGYLTVVSSSRTPYELMIDSNLSENHDIEYQALIDVFNSSGYEPPSNSSDYCQWHPVVQCFSTSHCVAALNMSNLNLKGQLSKAINNLTQLLLVDVSKNRDLVGLESPLTAPVTYFKASGCGFLSPPKVSVLTTELYLMDNPNMTGELSLEYYPLLLQLEASYTNITEIKFTGIPRFLQFLRANECALTHIDHLGTDGHCLTDLRAFEFGGNLNLKEWPKGLTNCSTIEVLKMYGIPGAGSIPSLKNLTKLYSIDFHSSNQTSIPDGICHSPTLEQLYGYDNPLGNDTNLALCFNGMNKLKDLDFPYLCPFQDHFSAAWIFFIIICLVGACLIGFEYRIRTPNNQIQFPVIRRSGLFFLIYCLCLSVYTGFFLFSIWVTCLNDLESINLTVEFLLSVYVVASTYHQILLGEFRYKLEHLMTPEQQPAPERGAFQPNQPSFYLNALSKSQQTNFSRQYSDLHAGEIDSDASGLLRRLNLLSNRNGKIYNYILKVPLNLFLWCNTFPVIIFAILAQQGAIEPCQVRDSDCALNFTQTVEAGNGPLLPENHGLWNLFIIIPSVLSLFCYVTTLLLFLQYRSVGSSRVWVARESLVNKLISFIVLLGLTITGGIVYLLFLAAVQNVPLVGFVLIYLMISIDLKRDVGKMLVLWSIRPDYAKVVNPLMLLALVLAGAGIMLGNGLRQMGGESDEDNILLLTVLAVVACAEIIWAITTGFVFWRESCRMHDLYSHSQNHHDRGQHEFNPCKDTFCRLFQGCCCCSNPDPSQDGET